MIQPALDRGAYQSTRAEEARLFYTALTRAERYLYVSGSEQLPAAKRAKKISPFTGLLAHAELSDDPSGLPSGLQAATPQPRIDEAVMPTTYSEIRYYLRCPADYRFRKSYGFSPPITEMFGFGMTVHAGVGKLHELNPDGPPSAQEAQALAEGIFHLKHVPKAETRNVRDRTSALAKARVGFSRITPRTTQRTSPISGRWSCGLRFP